MMKIIEISKLPVAEKEKIKGYKWQATTFMKEQKRLLFSQWTSTVF